MCYQCRNLILWISSHISDQYFKQLCCWFHGLVWFSRLMCQNPNMCGIDANNVFCMFCDECKGSASAAALRTLWFMVRLL